MKDKCMEVIEENEGLRKAEEGLRQQLEAEHRKCREARELRRKEKQELRQLIVPLLEALGGKAGSLSAVDVEKLSKMI
jgi:regulator of replication initiation timing